LPYHLTAILSDLHGNRPALEVALADARVRGVKRFVCLGDMVGYGAEPRFCLDAVMRLCVPAPRWDPLSPSADDGHAPTKIVIDRSGAAIDQSGLAIDQTGVAIDVDGVEGRNGEDTTVAFPVPKPTPDRLEGGLCLKGNHEEALLYSADDFNPKARAAIEWTRDEINRDPERSEAYWDFLGGLKASDCDDLAMFAHGSPREPVREYVLPRDVRDTQKMRALFAHLERPLCFIGHSHVPAVYFEDGSYFMPKGTEGPFLLDELASNRAIINVGSVGQPRDGDPRLSYALFDGKELTFVRLEYDVEAAAAAIRAVSELPDYLAERLAVGR